MRLLRRSSESQSYSGRWGYQSQSVSRRVRALRPGLVEHLHLGLVAHLPLPAVAAAYVGGGEQDVASVGQARRCQQPELAAPGEPRSVVEPATLVALHQLVPESLSLALTLVSFSSMLIPFAVGKPPASS